MLQLSAKKQGKCTKFIKTFNEDATRKKKNAAVNFSLLNKIALAAVKKDNSKGSLKGKRKRAGWDDSFLEKLLDAQL